MKAVNRMTWRAKSSVEFGSTLRAARIKRGISQAGLAAQIGVSQQMVHKWETGEANIPPVETCKKLVDFLDNGSLDQFCLVEK